MRNVYCPKSSQRDIKEKTVGEGQNGWLVPGGKGGWQKRGGLAEKQKEKLSLQDILGECQTFAENAEVGHGALLCWLLSNRVTSSPRPCCLIRLLYHLILVPQSSCSSLGVSDSGA